MKCCLLFFSLTLFLASQIMGAPEKPFFSYTHHAALSSYKQLSVTIDNSGRTLVQIEKSVRSDYHTQLGKEELEALRALIRVTDFFSQPDKDSSFATDTGLTEITVNDAGHSRTLTFSYRPTLQPLIDFVWKLFSQAEAWQALRSGDISTTMEALVEGHGGRKALQPYVFKQPLMEYLRSARENRKIEEGLGALAAVTTPEEFAGFVASQTRPGDPTSPLFRAGSDCGKAHRLALCPLYLAYLKDNHPHLNDFTRGDNITRFLADMLGEFRYEPAIPYFLGLFDEQSAYGLTPPLATLAILGRPCFHELVLRLDSQDEVHRLNAMEILAASFRCNSKNPITNAFNDYEFAEMQKDFEALILPKLTALSERDPMKSVRDKAARTIEQIRTELTKTDGVGEAFIKLEVLPDHTIRRTLLEGEKDRTVSWHMIKDGKAIRQEDAKGRPEFKVPDTTAGVYTIYVSVWSKGNYRVVSDIVSYKIESKAPP